jgi:hypothetical protein
VQHDARPLGIYSIIHPRPLAAGAGSQEASACAGSGGRRMHRRAVQGGGLPSTLARAAHCARQPQDKCCTEVEQRGQQPCWRSLRLRPPRRPYPRPPSCLRRPSFLVEPLQWYIGVSHDIISASVYSLRPTKIVRLGNFGHISNCNK